MLVCAFCATAFSCRVQAFVPAEWKPISSGLSSLPAPVCEPDTLVSSTGAPSYKMQGYYAIAGLRGNALDGRAKEMTVSGLVRIDSLTGMFEINVLMWEAGRRRDDMHVGTYSFRALEAYPGEWIPFSVTVPLCRQMELYDIEAKIKGAGTVWLSDIKVEYTGQRVQEPDERRPPRGRDGRFKKGSGFAIEGPLTETQTDNLSVLGRVWGFLKYLHPAVREGYYDWDSELFALLPRIYDAPKEERNAILYRWAESLGELTPDVEASVGDNLQWICETEELGEELSALLQRVACAKRTPYCWYAYPEPWMGTVEDRNERGYKKMDFSDDGLKLLAVYRIWNFVEYFFPYKDLADAPWSEALPQAVELVPDVETEREYLYALIAATKPTDDSHTNIMYRPSNRLKYLSYLRKRRKETPRGALFSSEKYLDGKFLVTYGFGDQECDLRRGDAILAINGQSVDDIIAASSFTAASNPGRYRRDVTFSATFPPASGTVTYTVDRDGSVMELSPRLYPTSEVLKRGRKSGIRERPKTYYAGRGLAPFDIIRDSIVYMDVEKLSTGQLDECLGYDKIIIDLRGSASMGFLSWLFKLLPDVKPIAAGRVPDLQKPGTFKEIGFTDMTFKGAGADRRRIVVLVDENTQSNAEYCTMALQTSPYVTTIGSRSAGADGNVVEITLPGEYTMMVGSLGLTYPDGRQCQRVGVRLDEEAFQTLESFRAGSDAVVERAVELLERP